jgi:hypothetical protein
LCGYAFLFISFSLSLLPSLTLSLVFYLDITSGRITIAVRKKEPLLFVIDKDACLFKKQISTLFVFYGYQSTLIEKKRDTFFLIKTLNDVMEY